MTRREWYRVAGGVELERAVDGRALLVSLHGNTLTRITRSQILKLYRLLGEHLREIDPDDR